MIAGLAIGPVPGLLVQSGPTLVKLIRSVIGAHFQARIIHDTLKSCSRHDRRHGRPARPVSGHRWARERTHDAAVRSPARAAGCRHSGPASRWPTGPNASQRRSDNRWRASDPPLAAFRGHALRHRAMLRERLRSCFPRPESRGIRACATRRAKRRFPGIAAFRCCVGKSFPLRESTRRHVRCSPRAADAVWGTARGW